MSTTPSTQVTRLREMQDTSRDRLDELLDSTPLATIALVRDGHPVVFPTGFARVWAGVVPMTVSYGTPLTAPDVLAGTPVPPSVYALSGDTPPAPR